MRAITFNAAYWLLSIGYVLAALPCLTIPGDKAVRWLILQYTKSMRWALRTFAGIHHEVRGRERLPEGSYVLAGKHQSWGDGFLVYPEIENIAFVTGDHLEKFPFVKGILQKLGAIVIDTCGGGEKKAASLANGTRQAAEDGRRVLIYPEGHLAPVDYHFRYKPGVWHLAKEMGVPIIPVATNVGLYWPQQSFEKNPGTAIIEFLPPVWPGEDKKETMALITKMVEDKTAELVAEGRGTTIRKTELIPDPRNGEVAVPPVERTV
ncbi:lysophospholipid acyltransferase family protein [Ponticaulis profundi]|uniref:Lysophospholipid acyltransferase family protein n=1 Tax=Ponticaulis profundi TaxID=2665222 RepID=A0ABW1SEQ7_9PROT